MYKREDFYLGGESRTFVSLKGTNLWISRVTGGLETNEGDAAHLFFTNRQEAEQALTEFLNNQNKGEKEMKKSDLKNGMVVEQRDGDKLMYLETEDFKGFVSEDDYMSIDEFDDDLLDPDGDDEYDIVAIYQPASLFESQQNRWDSLTPIWERPTHKEMTVADVEKELGFKVKIIK